MTFRFYGGGYDETRTVIITIVDNDEVNLVVSPSSLRIKEGESASYGLSLTRRPTNDVTVDIEGMDNDVRVLRSSVTFTPGRWRNPQFVPVVTAQDSNRGDKTVTLTHRVTSGRLANGASKSPVVVTVVDDEPGVRLSENRIEVKERKTDTYAVVLHTKPTGPVTVTPSSDNTDVATVSGALTFTTANWNKAQMVTVTGKNHTSYPVTVSHQVRGYGSVTTADPVRVKVGRVRLPDLEIPEDPLTVGEGESDTYTVKLKTQPTGSVTVTPSSTNTGAATVSGALVFTTANWNVAQTVTVTGVRDANAKNEEVPVSHTASGANYNNLLPKYVTVKVIDPDTAGVTVSPTELTVREGRSNTYTVKLKTQPVGGKVTVRPRSTNTGAATVSPLELTFTTANWNVDQTVTVSGEQENQGVPVTHTASGADYDDVGDVTVTVDIDLVPRLPTLRTEAGNGQVTLTWDALPPGVPVNRWQIDYRKINASSWETHTAPSTSTRTTVTGLENNFKYQFRICAINPCTESQWSMIVTETPVPTTVTLSSSNPLLVTEGSSESYEVSLNVQPRGDVTVRIESNDEGAATVSPEVLTFTTSDWETAQRVTVTGKTDRDGNNEIVTVSHSAEGDDVVGPGSLTVKVTDADTPEVEISSHELTVDEGGSNTYTVVLNTQPEGRVWVSVDKSGDEKDVVTISDDLLKFDASNWNIKQTVTITAGEDDDARDDSLTVIHEVVGYGEDPDPVNVTVKDNEPAPGKPENLAAWSGDKEVVLTWNNANDASITSWQVRYANSFRAGTEWKDIPDSDADTIKYKVKGLVNGSEYHFYVRAKNDAGNGTMAEQRGTPAAPAVTPPVIVPSKMRIVEGTTNSPAENVSRENMTYMVVQFLQAPTSDVTVNVTPSYHGLIVPESTKTFTVNNWNSNQKRSVTIPIYALNDDKEEDILGRLFVRVSGDYNQQPITVPVEIIDNDTSNVVVSRADLSIKEGKSASYEVSLSKEPDAGVNVTISKDSVTNDVSLSSSGLTSSSTMSLIFTTANWNVRKTVTVTASADNDGSDDKVTLTHSALGGGYDNVTGGSVVVTVKEDSSLLSLQSMLSLRPTAVAAGVTITPKELTVEEAKGDGHTATYTVVLNSAPTGDVTVTTTSADPQAAAVLAASRALTFTMMNWSTPQTVTVSGVADVDNAHETVTVSHGVSGANYEDVTADSVTVAVVDAEAAAQDAAQANKARAADLAATSRTLLGMATDVLSARRGDSAMGGGDEGASIGEQASVIMENLLRGGGDLAADIDLDGVEDRLWSQSFQISAPANDDGGLARQGRWSLWGAGELRSYSGEAEENISYSGNLKTAWLGVDYPFTDQWLAGLAVSTSSGQSDYSYQKTDGSTDGGKMENRLTTFYPYGSFQVSEQFRLWGMAGFGFGSQKHQPNDQEGDTAEGDLRIQMGALGFEQQLHSLGALQLSLAGDVGFARSTTTWEAGSDLGNLDVSISRARLGLEASFPLGRHTTGRVGVKGRLDGGELEMGAAEVLAGLHYQSGRFSGSLQGKQVYGFDGSYRESGLAAQLRFNSRPDGGGLAWELEPSYGTGAGDFALAGGQALWTDEQLEALTGHSSRDGEMEISSRVGYGIHLQEGELLLTPFTELSLYQGGSRSLGLGLALETPSWDVELSASTETNGSASPTNKLQLTFSKKL